MASALSGIISAALTQAVGFVGDWAPAIELGLGLTVAVIVGGAIVGIVRSR